MKLLKRERLLNKIIFEFKVHPMCGLLGPRQCGKTTLARLYAESQPLTHFFDCEDPRDLARLENPMLSLEHLEGLIIIDEIQQRPDLFPALRVLADQTKNRQFLILGSASPDLLHQSSETLAGRIGFQFVTPFTLNEVENWINLMNRGGFPRSFLAQDDSISLRWRHEYIKTFLERDFSSLFGYLPSPAIDRLWRMLGHYHACIINYSELSRSLGVSSMTVQRYVEALDQTFMVRRLKPWHTNLGKREIKNPKIYIRDTGLLGSLLEINTDLQNHPKVGAFFEGLIIEQIITLGQFYDSSFFWATHGGAELDLLIVHHDKKIGIEIKYTDNPSITKSMRIALEDLNLDHLYVVVPFETKFYLDKKITCLSLKKIVSLVLENKL